MEVLISGCSFTHWPDGPNSPTNVCWPRYLGESQPDWQLTNLAEPAAGNLYIANSVIRATADTRKKYDMVLVMWSGLTRLDTLTDLSNKDWAELFDSYPFYRRVEDCPNRLGYLFSGGRLGPWSTNAVSRKMFNETYKVTDNLSLGHGALIEILKLQAWLKSAGIPYRFMSYVNYWNDQQYVSPNGDFGVMRYPELRCLTDAIDWTQWIFADEHRNCIYEMAKQINDFHGDKFHPGAETNRRWAELVLKNL